MKKSLIATGAALSTYAFSLSASATSLVELDLKDLVDGSTMVVVGEAIAQENANTNDGAFTNTTFSVSDNITGGAVGNVTVSVPGGFYNNGKYKLRETYPGAPSFLPGMEVLMFLSDQAGNGNYSVVGFSQGALLVRDSIEGKVVNLPNDGLGPVSIDTAKAEINKVRANQRGSDKTIK